MDEPSLIFPAAEFRTRCAALQQGMAQAGLGALLLTTPADIFYVTGFLTRFWESPARPWFVVVPRAGAPIAVIPAIGADLMRRTWVRDIRTWDAPDPVDDGRSLLIETLNDITNSAPVGLPMGLETQLRMPLAEYHHLQSRFSLVDATRVVQQVREVKSPAEVDRIRASCAIADRAFARVPQIAGAGRPLDQVFRDFQSLLLQEGADWVSYLAGGAEPDGYGDVISPAPRTPLQAGDVLMLDTGAVRDGYFCDFDRNFAIGRASDTAKRVHAALWAATQVALDRLRPGMTAQQAHGMMVETLNKYGVTPLGGRMGHGLGLTLTEWPSLSAKDSTPLRAGMVLTLEPGVEVRPGCIMVHEENLLLTDDGAQLLCSRTPPDLPEIL